MKSKRSRAWARRKAEREIVSRTVQKLTGRTVGLKNLAYSVRMAEYEDLASLVQLTGRGMRGPAK